MPMSAATLKTSLKPAIISAMNEEFGPPADPSYLDKMANAIAQAVATEVISHITSSAVVSITIVSQPVTVASVSGVTTGPGVSGPGAGVCSGTATGTIA